MTDPKEKLIVALDVPDRASAREAMKHEPALVAMLGRAPGLTMPLLPD